MYPKEYSGITPLINVFTTDLFNTWFANLRDRRIHYGPGYRVYFAQLGVEAVLLLAGGGKSSQGKDIKAALKLAREL